MIIVSGDIRKIYPREYKDKTGKNVTVYDVDILDEDDRFVQTISFHNKPEFEHGDNAQIPCRVMCFLTKDGKPFIKYIAIEE